MKFKQKISALKLIPSEGGVFEVSVNGEKIYSKAQTGEFPQPADVISTVQAMI